MKAAVIEKFGDLNQIYIKQIQKPDPLIGEVQIEVRYVSVNPVEWKIAAGALKDLLPHQFPLILGWDVAGVVSAVGKGVSTLRVGDEVYGYCRKPIVQWGTFAEYVCFQAENVALKPKNITFGQAAALPLVSLTAWQALFDVCHVKKGYRVFIHAGAGGVGSMAIQFAKFAGAFVFTTASAHNHSYLKKLGADVPIDYQTQDFLKIVQQQSPAGVDSSIDCVGGETLERSYSIVRKGGTLVTIVGSPDLEKATKAGITAKSVFVRPDGQQLKEISRLIEKGLVVPPEITEMPFEAVVTALEQVKTAHTKGKIVLKVK